MAIDFNQAEEQREFVQGPVPAGSRVLLKIELQDPKPEYAAKPGSIVSKASSGMYQLNVQFTVMAGSYNGYHWFENMALPEGQQQIKLTDGQRDACRISYARMRAIIESARGIDPKDNSPRAQNGRKLNRYEDLNGMVFPARLGIKKKSRVVTGKDGVRREYWDNQLTSILTITNSEYQTIKNGGEVITDGPVSGESQLESASPYGSNDYASNASNAGSASAPIPGWDTPPEPGMDDMPF